VVSERGIEAKVVHMTQKIWNELPKRVKAPKNKLLKGLSRMASVKGRLKKGEPPSKPKYIR